MTPEGEAIIRYTLRNDSGAEVQLTNYGAAIVSVKMPDREGRMADVVLGYKHPEGYFFDGAASGKSVGRCANRIAFGQMTVEGKEYRLEVNNGVNHLHGGTKNFANRIWESRVETNRVVMSLLSEDGDQNYPGELNVEAVFDFDDENALEITYLARTDKTTVVNLTNHVYFNLAGERDNLLKGQGLFTSPVNLIVGLHESLSMLFEEGGLDALYRKQWALTCMVRTGALALDLPLFAPTHYAWGVTSIMLPAGVDGDKLLKVAADECGIVFAGGQDHYKGRMVRFGHMGWVDWADALAGLHALAHGLRASGGFSASRDYLETALSAYHRALDVEPGRVIPDVRS